MRPPTRIDPSSRTDRYRLAIVPVIAVRGGLARRSRPGGGAVIATAALGLVMFNPMP
jgi:hypothetical protein